MPIEEIAANYGLAGVALVLMFKMYMENVKAMRQLSEAIEKLGEQVEGMRKDIYNFRLEYYKNKRA